jgi:hypothetical protein
VCTSKYLNKIFVVSREVVSDGVVTVAQDYSQLGDLLWVVVVSSFVIPIIVINDNCDTRNNRNT